MSTALTVVAGLALASTGASELSGPYLGQEPPGETSAPFAPGVVSTPGWEYGGVFSPEMTEFFFLKEDETGTQVFSVFEVVDDVWRERIISPRRGQPFVSPDGQTLHLGRRYMDRTAQGLSDVIELGAPFEQYEIMRLTASLDGLLVFDEFGSEDGDGVLRFARRSADGVTAPQPLPDVINDGSFSAHPFIAPDESYILWDTRRPDGQGGSDIYVSFRQGDGDWGPAINLGDAVNTPAWEASASVTPDGKYLFFNRMMGPGPQGRLPNVDMYWVDASVLERLRPNN